MYTRRLVLVSTYIWFMAKLPKSLLNPSLLGPWLLPPEREVKAYFTKTFLKLLQSQQFLYIFMTHITTLLLLRIQWFLKGLFWQSVQIFDSTKVGTSHIHVGVLCKIILIPKNTNNISSVIGQRTLLNNEACIAMMCCNSRWIILTAK